MLAPRLVVEKTIGSLIVGLQNIWREILVSLLYLDSLIVICKASSIIYIYISLVGQRKDNTYAIFLRDIPSKEAKCFASTSDQS